MLAGFEQHPVAALTNMEAPHSASAAPQRLAHPLCNAAAPPSLKTAASGAFRCPGRGDRGLECNAYSRTPTKASRLLH